MATRKTMYTTLIINMSSVVQMDRWSILKIVTNSEHYIYVYIIIRVRMLRFLVSIDRKIFRFGSSLTATCRSFKTNNFKRNCVRRHMPRHTCGVPRQLINRCTKHGAIYMFTLESWHGAGLCHFAEVLENFLYFGRVISQKLFRNFTFEIISVRQIVRTSRTAFVCASDYDDQTQFHMFEQKNEHG